MELLIALLVVALTCGFIGIYIASSKGRADSEGWWFGLLLGPLGLIILRWLPGNKRTIAIRAGSHGSPQRTCPFCAQMVLAEAAFCKFCRKDLPPGPIGVASLPRVNQETRGDIISNVTFDRVAWTLLAILVVLAIIAALFVAKRRRSPTESAPIFGEAGEHAPIHAAHQCLL